LISVGVGAFLFDAAICSTSHPESDMHDSPVAQHKGGCAASNRS